MLVGPDLVELLGPMGSFLAAFRASGHLNLGPPLVYQSTTSLGLGQVQMPGPKVVVATGAAARGSKKWYNFFAEIKTSSPVKYEHIHPLWHYLRIQSLKFGTNLVSARWILEQARTSIQTFYSD